MSDHYEPMAPCPHCFESSGYAARWTGRMTPRPHPDDVKAVLAANRPHLLAVIAQVKAAMEKNNARG